MRKAFSMLTAIFIIVLMATVAAFIMNLSGKMVKGTTAQFQHEQSVLLAKSYTEYAIMAVTANEHNTSTCLNNISGGYGDIGGGNYLYNIDVNISYIGDTNLHANCRTLSNSVVATKSPLNIIVDVFVKYKDLDHPAGANTPDTTYHRRSLQKI
ncbi:hypothetical protein TSL6_13160 [Sulfurovum sp. TSL6]|uniref:type II secretion system protein n=1 Tax=Sulfurovum sp. TSL6 TaxID=2826995 RepID=UPI001CC54586|nr:type II secretion system protein [Sulfurovum sp. TSL6]GIU00810.1 hypothetical protein TSL6_13160 [Sulfurovum sp. TSL6]